MTIGDLGDARTRERFGVHLPQYHMMEASDFSADEALRRRDSMKQLPRKSRNEVGIPGMQKDARHASAERTRQ